jgi:hypothetical protein
VVGQRNPGMSEGDMGMKAFFLGAFFELKR